MNSPPALSRPPVSPARSGWGQFSLLWLLTIVIAGCLVAAWYGEKRRRAEAEQTIRHKEEEVRELRVALGMLDEESTVLVITDRNRVHVRLLPMRDELEWRWRMFVPPGKAWSIDTSLGESWDAERGYYTGGGAGTSLKLSGEFTLHARLMRDLEHGHPFLEITHGRSQLRGAIPDEGLAVLDGNGKLTHQLIGQTKQESFEPQGQIELLRWFRASNGSAPPEGFGISIRIEEEEHKLARIRRK